MQKLFCLTGLMLAGLSFLHSQSPNAAIPKQDAIQKRITLQKAIEKDSSAGNYHQLGNAYREMALTYSDEARDETPLRISFAEKAKDAYQKAGNLKEQADMLKAIAELNMYGGKMQEAILKLKESIALYKEAKYDTIQEAYSLAGVAYSQIGNHNEALQYGLEAAKIAEHLKDQSPEIGVIYNYLAVTYDKLGDRQKAKDYLLKAMAISEKYKDYQVINLLGVNIANIYVKLNQPQEALAYLQNLVKKYPVPDEIFARLNVTSRFLYIYIHLKDYQNAERYCKQLIEICKEIPPDDPEQTVAYPAIINFFRETKQYEQAQTYIALLKDISEKNGFIDRLGDVYLQSYAIDSARGDFKSAIANYKQYKIYNDSFLAQSKTREVARLNIQYETEKKDRDIQVLKEEGELRQGVLEKTRSTRNWMVAAVVLLLISVGLLYNRYTLKKKSNSKINEQNQLLQQLVKEKEWLLKEIHHRVKNNLHTIYSLLETQSAYLTTNEAIEAIRDSQHRINAMSLIHQKLYRNENFSLTNMHTYIDELACYFNDTGAKVNFELDIEQVEFDVSYSVPVGLILNEAITNSIKYAFNGNENRTIAISLHRITGDQFLLTIKDNGKGLPAGFDPQTSRSLGMSLMKGLSEDIRGRFEIITNGGTEVRIVFTYLPVTQDGTHNAQENAVLAQLN